jgi:hypothetical protein
MARFIGYPTGKVLAVFDTAAAADDAVQRLAGGAADPAAPADAIERFHGTTDADRFDATGERHGLIARALRAMQFSLMDQLPAMAWYEAALRDGRTVVAVRTRNRPATTAAGQLLKDAGGHFINHFGRLSTEEFARWRGPEPRVASLMKH